MAKRLFTPHTLRRIAIIAVAIVMLVTAIALFAPKNPTTSTAQCNGCQACYCDGVIGPCCVVGSTVCASCVGCLGSCTGNPPHASCTAKSGVGGCGTLISWARDSDCNGTPPGPPPTATPKPPASCKETTWVKVQEPKSNIIGYEPPYPLVARQDTTNTGFTLHFNVTGGWAKKYEQKPEQMCRQSGKTYPDDCPNDWRWVCVRKVIEKYDDPIVEVKLGMRLGDGVKEWIEQDLGSRYYGAKTQDPLPALWLLYKGETMSWTDDFEFHPYDPGVHGGRLFVTTKGTPISDPQQVSFPYTVPVYLWDTTEGGE